MAHVLRNYAVHMQTMNPGDVTLCDRQRTDRQQTLRVRELRGDSDVINVFQWSGIELDVAMYAGVVEEIKLIVLNKVAGRVTAQQSKQCNITNCSCTTTRCSFMLSRRMNERAVAMFCSLREYAISIIHTPHS